MKSLKEYTEPELKVKRIDWSDIIVTSGGTNNPDPEPEPAAGGEIDPGQDPVPTT